VANLFTFGCSFTYGHGLKDCLNGRQPGPQPSRMAWPQKLGERTGLVVHNYGKPGADNLTILSKIMENHNAFKADDTVAILWSFNNRYSYFNKDQMRYVTTQITPYGIAAWSRKKGDYVIDKEGKQYNHYHAHFSSVHNDRIRSLLIANTAYSFLKSKVKTVVQSSIEPIVMDYFTKELNCTNMKDYWGNIITSKDKAADGVHPGEKAHEQFADYLHSMWKSEQGIQ